MLADAIDRRNREEGKAPVIAVWENVPGVFSTSDNAFGFFLRGLAGSLPGEDGPLEPPGGKWTHCGVVLGPQRAIAWRVQDAQYHGLAQRRQRVFVVASARDGFDPSQVLLEWEGVRRDSAPSREARKEAPAPLGGRAAKRDGGGSVGNFPWPQDVADPLTTNEAKTYTQEGSHNFRTRNVVPHVVASTSVVSALTASGRGVERPGESRGQDPLVVHIEPQGFEVDDDCALTLTKQSPTGGGQIQSVMQSGMVVRRLTPRECERLQGFPDDYTSIPWKNKPAVDCPDGPRYKALGNSMAVPCMRWIGRRIAAHVAALEAEK